MPGLSVAKQVLGSIPWPAIAATLIAILLAVVVVLVRQTATLRTEVGVANERAEANAAVLLEERRLRARADRISLEVRVRIEALQRSAWQRQQEIERMPNEKDGPIAPVLRAALDGLRADDAHRARVPSNSP